jgi:DNA invertase Pin-like site-specific DNA recombinase
MPVIEYTRVSMDEQAREGVSLAAQAAKISASALVKDWEVCEIIEEAGAVPRISSALASSTSSAS